MSMAGLSEDLARQIRQSRPTKESDRSPGASPASSGGGKRGRAPKPPPSEAERSVRLRLFTCDLLFKALRAAAKVLETSGRDLQRVHATVCAKDGFRQALESGDPPLAASSLATLEALASLGSTLSGLSGALGGGALDGLQRLQADIRESCKPGLEEAMGLEDEEFAAVQAVRLATEQKSKLESAANKNDEDSGWSGWFKKGSSSPSKSQAAALQKAAEEDLASHVDRAAAAAASRKQHSEAFGEVLREIDARCVEVFASFASGLGGSWGVTVASLEEATRRYAGEGEGGNPRRKQQLAQQQQAQRRDGAATFSSLSGGGGGAGLRGGAGDRDASPAALSQLEVCILEQVDLRNLADGDDEEGEGEEEEDTILHDEDVNLQEDDDEAEKNEGAGPGRGGGEAEAEKQAGASERRGAAAAAAAAAESAAAAAAGADDDPAAPGSTAASAPSSVPSSAPGSARAPASARGAREGGGSGEGPARAGGGEGAATGDPAAGSLPPIAVHFGNEVVKLGFEVLWEAPFPTVLKLVPGGEAQRVGMQGGDALQEINGIATLGKSRAELMPQLKVRPLEIVLLRWPQQELKSPPQEQQP